MKKRRHSAGPPAASSPSSARSREVPWLAGTIDALVACTLLQRSIIPHRNRLCLILLDSAVETGCRAYMRYVAKIKLEEAHKSWDNLMKLVRHHLTSVDAPVWDRLQYFHDGIRNDLYHEAASKTITDDSLTDYREAVEFVLDAAFNIRSSELAAERRPETVPISAPSEPPAERIRTVSAVNVPDRVGKLVLAIASLSPQSFTEINEFFKREGDATRLTSDEFTGIVARNRGSKRLFYYEKATQRWQLSGLGRFKLSQMTEDTDAG